MSELKKLGEKLKRARETKGLSIRDVFEKTNITPKFIEALEEEDYSVFPSETYTIGFLRSYAEFLNFDPNEIVKEYKGLKLQNSESPLEELTKATQPKFEFTPKSIKNILIFFIIAFSIILIYKIAQYTYSSYSISEAQNLPTLKPCNEREKRTINVKDEEPLLSLLDISSLYLFSIGAEKINFSFCIKEIEKKDNYENIKFVIEFNQKNYELEAKSGETLILSNTISELTQNNKKIELSIKGASENSIQIELQSKQKAVSNKSIIVTLEIIQETYIEWISDGKAYKGEFFKNGDSFILEADNRLDIKIGNGAGVRFTREGFPPRIAGPAGKIVKLSFTKIQDPIDLTKFKIDEQIIVAQ